MLQSLRSLEGNEAQVCFLIIQLLLLKPNDFRNRVSEFVKEVSNQMDTILILYGRKRVCGLCIEMYYDETTMYMF